VAIKSALNPGAIVNERPVSVSAATNFITGGSDLGQGVLSSAANKIVGFGRGTGTVAPRVPDLGSIINTLSTNILNNVEGKLQSINQNVVNIVNNTLQTISTDYKGKLAQLESDRPNNVLNNFLRLYKDALGFIQFLGNRKNIKTLGDNLESLRKVFQETFDVAKVIRKTIIKIVEQLSNLPTASGSGGGLNLDVNIPGANVLGRAAPKGLASKFGKAALIGGGVVAAGALGSQVVSGMADVGGDVAPTPMGDPAGGLSGPILDKFNSILDRFSAAIANFKPGENKQKQTLAPGKEPAPSNDNKNLPTPTPGEFTGKGVEKGAQIAQRLQKDLGISDFQASAIVGNLLNESSQLNPAQMQGSGSGLLPEAMKKGIGYGWAQWTDPGRQKRLYKYAKDHGVDPDKQPLTDEINYGFLVTELSKDYSGVLKDLKASKNIDESTLLILKRYESPADQGPREQKERADAARAVLQKQSGLPAIETKKPSITAEKSKVSAAPSQSTTAQEVSKQVAQTPGANQPAKSLIVPIDASSREQVQQNKPAAVSQRPIMSDQGTSIPNINSTNGNNYLTLYSKLTYNIV
jgi:hypothetical protein